jgi:mono/diheme cytochrome c family protein
MAGLELAALGLIFAFVPPGHLHASAADGGDGQPALAQPTDTGKELFARWACGTCHVLAEAGASGQVGPPLDGDPNLTEAVVVNRITYGQGGMQAYGGQLSEEEIADIAAYIMRVAAK